MKTPNRSRPEPGKTGKRVIFIDRDGVINKDPGGWTEYNYVTRWKDFHFIRGSKAAVRKLNRAGYYCIVISNQAGVSKGHYSENRLRAINSRMLKEIKKSGGKIRSAYYCIHQDSDNCGCRKPKTGLVRLAERNLGIAARGAYFIGDSRVDVEAGKKAGMRTVLVLTGKTSVKDLNKWKIKPDLVFKDLSEAVDFILSPSP
ncbi:MAG: HAD family hydrolase [Candidatus Omnitrophota bacterium]|nr:HAD family hydrolase [Candidatus Omnitrophota bacterium]